MSVSLCACAGGQYVSLSARLCLCMSTMSISVCCVASRVYIYLYVCVFLKLCVSVSACLYLQVHVLVYVCSFRIVCLRYEGLHMILFYFILHMILKACVCVCVCVCTCASAFLITDVCVILRVYFKVSIVHRPMHAQGGCVSMQGQACTKEKCLGTRVCVHVCIPVSLLKRMPRTSCGYSASPPPLPSL